MASKPELRKAVLLGVFRRRGGIGARTFLLDDCGASLRDVVLSGAELTPGELPILVSAPTAEGWILITSHRVVVAESGDIRGFDWGDIARVDPEMTGKLTSDADRAAYLTITDVDGSKTRIQVEAGAPYIGLLNVLMRVIRMGRR
jgi:hypothetical protein